MDKNPCFGKVGFDCKKDAKKKARQVKANGRNKMKAYPCGYCGFWHLTSHINMNYTIQERSRT